MVKAIVQEASLPPSAMSVVSGVKSFGFGWKYVEEAHLGTTDKRVQVRKIKQLAPPREVSKYQQDLRRGDQFPPVVLTADGYLVDGSTRTEAVRKIGWRTFHAVMLDVKFEGAPQSVRNQLIALGASFNATHGKRMTADNFAEIINTIAVEDDTPKDIARRLHLSESMANTMLNAAKAQHRATLLGVKLDGSLSNSHLRLFGSKSDKFTSPVFKAFIKLTQDAHLSLAATTDLSKRLAVVGTEQERLALLRAETRAYRSVIQGGASNPSRAAKLRQSLGYLINTSDPDVLAEHDPLACGLHFRTLRQAKLRLEQAIEAQERVEQTRITFSE